MKKIIVIILALIVLTGVVWYFATREAPAPKATDLLPDSTLLYVAMPDFPKSRAQFQQTQLYALWQEPDVQAFLEKPRAALREAFGAGKRDSTLNAFLEGRVASLLQGEIFLAVTHINPPPFVSAGIVLGADVKNNRLEAQAYLKLVEHDLARYHPNASADEKRYLGTTYEVWQLNDHLRICHAFLNSLLVFSLDENVLRDVITRFAKQAPADAKPLTASAQFQNVRQHMPPGHAVLAYLNVEQVLNTLGAALPYVPFVQKFANIQASAASVTLAGELIEDVSLVATKSRAVSPAIERRTLALTSPDTSLYSVHSFDLASAYRQGLDAIAQAGNATLTSAASRFERALRDRHLRLDDVLAGVGPEVALIGTWREGARWADLALVAEVKNAAALRPKLDLAMDALASLTNRVWDTQEYLGETLHVVHVGADVISPSYVVTDKFLILALTADHTRALVAQSKNAGPTLAANAHYARTTKSLPEHGTSYTYCDLRPVFGALYSLARVNTDANQFVDFGKLPATETLTKHLAPFASASVDTPELQTTTTFSTLGKPLTFVAGLAGVAGAAQPWLTQFIPAWPTMSSGSRGGETPRGQGGNPPARSRTAQSQTPAP